MRLALLVRSFSVHLSHSCVPAPVGHLPRVSSCGPAYGQRRHVQRRAGPKKRHVGPEKRLMGSKKRLASVTIRNSRPNDLPGDLARHEPGTAYSSLLHQVAR
jgi:hypothetical protein